MRWPGIETLYGESLQQTPIFSVAKRWEDLHTRVIEHVRWSVYYKYL
jgi:26S proteasome regulatory subunit N5